MVVCEKSPDLDCGPLVQVLWRSLTGMEEEGKKLLK